MNKNILLLVLLLITIKLNAQTTIDVNFDNYTSPTTNDFTDKFSGNSILYQIPTNGITGGCLVTPATNNWGNDNALFCSTYKLGTPTNLITSICFKFDSTLFNNSVFERTCSIWLIPFSDFNHYAITSISTNKKMQLLTYSSVNDGPVMTLLHNHWYKLETKFIIASMTPPYNIGFDIKTYDLGLTGTGTPQSIGSIVSSFQDSTLAADTNIVVGITGTTSGGAIYLDNFHYEGLAGTNLCPVTSISNIDLNETISIIYSHNVLSMNNTSNKEVNSYIYDLNGKLILNLHVPPGTSQLAMNALPAGLYIYHVTGSGASVCKRIAVIH